MDKKQLVKKYANELRNDSFIGEIILWNEVLKRKSFYGYQFNRQFVIGNFIVDFICRKLKLIIEVDGKYHEDIIEQDIERDKKTQEVGYRVPGISEYEVVNDLNNVIGEPEFYLPE